jgi:hypothetical protein
VAAYHVGGDDWDEATLTWRSRPAPDPIALDTETGTAADQWDEWEVTAAVSTGGLHSFALRRLEPENADIDWNSRENAASAPELSAVLPCARVLVRGRGAAGYGSIMTVHRPS